MGGGKRLGCDIGGTFTDFVVIDDADGTIRLEKVLSTPVSRNAVSLTASTS